MTLKVLVLPYNVASIPAITVKALNKIPGVTAKGFSIGSNIYTESYEHYRVFKGFPEKSLKNIPEYSRLMTEHIIRAYRLIKWADVLHWYWGSYLPFGLDLKLAKLLKKRGVVEWVGSDIRIPETLMLENPFFKKAFQDGVYEYQTESMQRSMGIQRKFASLGFEPAVTPEMKMFVKADLFEKTHIVFARLFVSEMECRYPPVEKKVPLVVHSPSAKGAKGSEYVMKAVEELRSTHEFEFKLLNGLPRKQVHEIMLQADIFLDQFIGGGYGMASCEAMSMGKPVLCYLMEKTMNNGVPSDVPIVNTSPLTLKGNLARFIENPTLRHETGIRSRAFAEKYHDADKIALQLVSIYKNLQKRQTVGRINKPASGEETNQAISL